MQLTRRCQQQTQSPLALDTKDTKHKTLCGFLVQILTTNDILGGQAHTACTHGCSKTSWEPQRMATPVAQNPVLLWLFPAFWTPKHQQSRDQTHNSRNHWL